ncbi:MAG: hypothetical protein ABL962_13525 [Fimbriimonadaceae bacterium]
MRASTMLGLLLAISVSIGSLAAESSLIVVSKFTPNTNGLFSANLQQEFHLPVALFQETNTSFDTKVYESVRTDVKPPMIVSILLVTFIFSSPNTNDPVYSFCEMGTPDELICTGTNVSRRLGSTNEIPLIRVSTVNRHKKEVTADLDLLLGVAPLNDPKDIRYLRRSFRFIYRDGWKED